MRGGDPLTGNFKTSLKIPGGFLPVRHARTFHLVQPRVGEGGGIHHVSQLHFPNIWEPHRVHGPTLSPTSPFLPVVRLIIVNPSAAELSNVCPLSIRRLLEDPAGRGPSANWGHASIQPRSNNVTDYNTLKQQKNKLFNPA